MNDLMTVRDSQLDEDIVFLYDSLGKVEERLKLNPADEDLQFQYQITTLFLRGLKQS